MIDAANPAIIAGNKYSSTINLIIFQRITLKNCGNLCKRTVMLARLADMSYNRHENPLENTWKNL